MGQIVSSAAKPKRCNKNQLSQVPTPAAGEYILVSSDNSMNAAGQGNFDCYIEGDGTKAATALPLIKTYANDVDNELTAGSDKLVKSGVVYEKFKDIFGGPANYTEGVKLDANGRIAEDSDYCTSDYIELPSLQDGDSITFSVGEIDAYTRLVIYAEDKSILERYTPSAIPRTISITSSTAWAASAKYIRIPFKVTKKDSVYVEHNTTRIYEVIEADRSLFLQAREQNYFTEQQKQTIRENIGIPENVASDIEQLQQDYTELTPLKEETGLVSLITKIDGKEWEFEQGSMSSTGANSNNLYRLRLTNAVSTDVGYIAVPDGFLIHEVYYYSSWESASSFSFVSPYETVGSRVYKVKTDQPLFRFSIRKTNNGAITFDNLKNALPLVSTLLDNYIDSVTGPAYVDAERERVYKELLSRVTKEVVVVGFSTDQHYNVSSTHPSLIPRYVLQGADSLNIISKTLPMDMVVLGGDVPGYYSLTIPLILEEINMLVSKFDGKNALVSLPGNHDAFQNNSSMTAQAMYNVNAKVNQFNKYFVHNGTDNCDGYIDDSAHKIRYIFIDTYSRNVRTESYVTFLTSALSELPEDYDVILFSHNPLTNEFTGIVKLQDKNEDAFANPTDLHSILDNYADRIIACICGHSHADVYAYSSSGILYIETTCACQANDIRHQFDNIPYLCTLNSAKDTSFDIFVIDKESQTVEAIRYGQGSNRLWKYKGTGQGLISYRNCLSGSCSVPSTTLTFSSTNDVVTASVGSDGKYTAYLKLGETYAITATGYSVSTNTVTLSENTELNLTLSE